MPITPSTRSGSERCCRCGSTLCATPAGSEPPVSRSGSIPLRRLRRGRRVPLAAAHARDLDALEQPGLAERLVARERLRLRAARHVEDEATADAPDAVVGDQRPAQHQDVPVLLEVGEVRVPVGGADLGAVVAVFLIDDVEHALSSARLRTSVLARVIQIELVRYHGLVVGIDASSTVGFLQRLTNLFT